MAERVRQSHVVATDDTILPMLSVGKTQSARMWVYVGDAAHPYNVFDFTLNRGRDGPRYFLRDYQQVLLADARRRFIDAEKGSMQNVKQSGSKLRAHHCSRGN